jgi:hypothetical protein
MVRLFVLLVSCLAFLTPAQAAGKFAGSWSRPEFAKRVLVEPFKDMGWVMIRQEAGSSWIYFTTLLAARCAITEVRYSINSDALDRVYLPMECDPFYPSAIPSWARLDDIAVRVGPPEVQSITVQAAFSDGTTTEIVRYAPCPNAGARTCVVRLH